MDAVINFRISISPEDIEPDFKNEHGKPDTDLIAEIYKRLESDLWAWCYVTVSATISGCPLIGRAGLGGCSYFGGEVEFTQPGGYFDDLRREAQADLLRQIREVKRIKLPEECTISEGELIGYLG